MCIRDRDETLEAHLVTMEDDRVRPGPWTLRRGRGSQDLERLADLARKEFSARSGSVRQVLGRPWPLAVLASILALQLIPDLLRLRWFVFGAYSWIPVLPFAVSAVLYVTYLLVIAATAVGLWLRISWSYRLALVLATVQFVRPIVLVISRAPSASVGWMVWTLLLGWLFPAFIVTYLFSLSRMRAHAPTAAR